MAEEIVNFIRELTPRQTQAMRALERPEVRRLLFGGAKGGGKSWFLCMWVIEYCTNLIKRFKLYEPTKNPIHVGWMGRKQAVDFTATTLGQTWRQEVPEEYWEIKSGTEKESKHILFLKTVAIDYGGLDRQENVNKFNSAQYGFIALDQAEETTRDDVSVMQGSLRLKIQGETLPYKQLYTANPAKCWLKEEFIDSSKPESVFVPALPADNPYLPDDYVKTLQDAFGYRPELLNAYLYGKWEELESIRQVILSEWLSRARGMNSLVSGRVIACDPARFGDDKTVIMVMDGTEILERLELGYCRTTEISSKLAELSRRYDDLPIVVDEIGIGAGVCDELYGFGRQVIPFNGANKAENEAKFVNLRAEAWWDLAESLAKGEVGCMRMYGDLSKQLAEPNYDFRGSRILIENKEDIKQRLGRSPDDADCYVMGVWGAKIAGKGINKISFETDNYKPYNNRVLQRDFPRVFAR